MSDASDMELIREYAESRAEAAFAEIVRHHLNFVYSVAVRITGNSHDAQDVAQAVFIILARKAAGLRPKSVLTGWLYETTRFTAMRSLRTKVRREIHEQKAIMQSPLSDSPSGEVWRQLAPLLEEAMTRLGEKDRALVALRYFENKTGAETAALLGVGEWAARKRSTRALEKLRVFFARRGVTSSTSDIAAAISAHSIQVAPEALAKTVVAAAMSKGAAAGGSTLTLIKGALKVMAWSKVKTAILLGVGALIIGGGATPFIVKKITVMRHNAMMARRKIDWLAESERERARIQSRQSVDETSGATTIDLRPYINAKLTDSPRAPHTDNNLVDLPEGVNIYAGVPFDVEGSIQLFGNKVMKKYPNEVDGIRIGRRCTKLHVFHGANWVLIKSFGEKVASLVLHYEDGSTRTIDMVAGSQVFDWWFPLFKTGVDPKFFQMDPGTERAWTGTNGYLMRPWKEIKGWDTNLRALILYKSTFANPQPSVAVTSVDYVKDKSDAAPFMVGLTVE